MLGDLDFWKNASIPFVAALVGWVTNWVAIEMTFRPLEYRGRRPFGWQGIIPSKATKMAAIFVDQTMHRLGTMSELFRQMDPDRIARHIVETMQGRVAELTDEVMDLHHRSLWRLLPQAVKNRVYARVREDLPQLVESLVGEVTRNVEDLLDFKHMIVSQLERDKALLNRLFLESGRAEFRFLVNSGLYFGFLFGLVQLGVWLLYRGGWVLPVFGLVVGFATNWLAIDLIFRPLYPKRFGPWRIQGLFLKRQREVAEVWCRIVTKEILTLPNLAHELLTGQRSARVHELIKRHIAPLADEAAGLLRPVARMAIGGDGFARLRETVGERAVDVAGEPFDHWPFIRERAELVEQLLRKRMAQMPPDQFQDLLRPCFQEDEWILILVGAALGLLAGLGQLVLVFGGVG